MNRTLSVTINFAGGIVSPGQLLKILEVAEVCHVTEVRFGLRQQLLLDIPVKYSKLFTEQCTQRKIQWQLTRESLPNIASSYVGTGIFTNDSWLTEGIYKDVFSMFDQQPRIKINICDSKQTFVPFFTGHINWVCTSQLHYWHLYLRMPGSNILYCWPEEIYTNHIGLISAALEELLVREKEAGTLSLRNGNYFYHEVKERISYISTPLAEIHSLPTFHLPYYEGFNKQGNSYWLGIYRRDEFFPVDFLKEVCEMCLDTKIGQFYTTPWKSLIIKNIETEHRQNWDYILGKYRINVRHAANELNWQLEDTSEDALILKRLIIRHFDKEDVRTYGLSFCIQLKKKTGMFGSVVIRKCDSTHISNRLKSLERYDILYTTTFNPNEQELVMFRENVAKEYLGTYLVSLSKFFYEDIGTRRRPATNMITETPAIQEKKQTHYCSACFTVYDETSGDPSQNIVAGTLFTQLPATYICPTCDEPVAHFKTTLQASSVIE